MHWRKARGKRAEDVAQRYLENRGLRPVDRNYRCRRGEIDLIMRDRTGLVFVEVRYRRHTAYGCGAESVDRHKRRRLIATALYYLQRERGSVDVPVRFDVVSISETPEGPAVQWIRDAFQAE